MSTPLFTIWALSAPPSATELRGLFEHGEPPRRKMDEVYSRCPLTRWRHPSRPPPRTAVTGLFLQQIELTAKRVQLLKDGFPDMKAATVFWDRLSSDQWDAARDAGAKLGLRLAGVELRDPPYDFDRALAEAPEEHRKNLLVMTSPFFFRDRARLADLALRNRAASMFSFRE